MTDISAVGGTGESPSRVGWVPIEGRMRRAPSPELFIVPSSEFKSGDSIRVIFDSIDPRYPRPLVILFVAAAIVSIFALLGLLVVPLLRMTAVTTALLFGLAFGLGGLAFAIGCADRIRDRL